MADAKSVPKLTYPFGLAAVPAGVFGGGVFVGDGSHARAPVQIDAAGQQVRRMAADVPPVHSLCVAHGFVLCASTVHVISIATGKEGGTVRIADNGQPVALRTPWCVLIVDEMMVVAESAHAVSIWPLPPRFRE
jgi:hypothetical protein